MSTFGLTPRQRQVMTTLEALTGELGRAPSLEEIRSRLGYRHKGGIYEMMKRLAERGVVTVTPSARGPRLVRPAEPDCEIVGLFDAPWLFSEHDRLMIGLVRSDPLRAIDQPVGGQDVR